MTRNKPEEVRWYCKLKKKYDNLVNTTLTKWSRLTLPVIIHVAMISSPLITSPLICFPQTHNPRLIMRKTWNPTCVAFYQMPDQHSSKHQSLKSKETMRHCPWPGKTTETPRLSIMRYPILAGVLGQKKGISGKTGAIQIKSRIQLIISC